MPLSDGQLAATSALSEQSAPTPHRRTLLAVTLLAFIASIGVFGYPTGREAISGWVLAFLFAACGGNIRVWSKAVLRDWLPLFALLFLYDRLRGAADDVGARLVALPLLANGRQGEAGIDYAHVLPHLEADRLVFAGAVPPVWLQARFNEPGVVEWQDMAATVIYMSHFVVPFAVAFALWVSNYGLFRRYLRAFVSLVLLTLTTYVLFPAAPPWMASLNGYLTLDIERVVSHTLLASNVDTVHAVVAKGEAYANAVAAVPSLHGGLPMLFWLFFWPLLQARGRLVLAIYPLSMLLTVVYTGEHYVSDVLVGWIYAAVALKTSAWLGRGRRRSSASRGQLQPRIDKPADAQDSQLMLSKWPRHQQASAMTQVVPRPT
jgi:hypothetical protein